MKRVVCIACLGALTGLFAYETNGAEFTLKPGEDAGRVRDEIRAARKAGKIGPDEPVTVTLSPGDHVFRQTLTLEAADSGAEGAPVTWRAEKPGTVRLMGGAPIPRDAFRPVAGDARQRLDPAVADKVLVGRARAARGHAEALGGCAEGLSLPGALALRGREVPAARALAERRCAGKGLVWLFERA